MPINSIAEYLKNTTGLDSRSIGISVVEHAIKKRMMACDISTHFEYYNLLLDSKVELSSLIDQVMIPETWFFRGRETFEYLKAYLTAKAHGVDFTNLRILSVPCSTGEEPYSISIVLTECGYNHNQYVIDAVDIARESLQQANNALFTDHSFRDEDDQIKRRYFSQVEDGFKLDDSIAKSVNFLYGNIFDLEVDKNDKYDIVFCRNLLIYFDKDTQRKALAKLDSLMADDGILFIGHGEAGCILGSQFKKINLPNTFAFTKNINQRNNSAKKIVLNNRTISHKKVTSQLTKKNTLGKYPAKDKLDPTTAKDDIEEAAKLADKGKFTEAIEKCKNSINVNGVSADALCLLGVIHDAIGERAEAVNYYSRALHLMPSHYQTLMHLASHAERDGDKLKASQYRMKAMQAKEAST